MDKILLLTPLLAFTAALLALSYRCLQLYRLLTQAAPDPAGGHVSPPAKHVTIISLTLTRERVEAPAAQPQT